MMNDELNDLRRKYRNITAPPALATRVLASVPKARVRHHGWLPVAASLVAVVVVIGLAPFDLLPHSGKPSMTLRPSLSALATLKPGKPAVPAPNFARLRSVSVPSMPAKPPKLLKPQTNNPIDYEFFKEKYHAHI